MNSVWRRFEGLKILVLLLLLTTASVNGLEAAGNAQTDTPGDGVNTIVGEVSSKSGNVTPVKYFDPSPVLLDMSQVILGKSNEFVPDSAQILGIVTTPLFPGPGAVRFNLPIVPTAAYVDVDNNGKADIGIQVMYLTVAPNLVLDSYLQQSEQQGGMSSILLRLQDGLFDRGTVLVYAPDANQGFPSGLGADGVWFTADDPTVPLPQGYSVAVLTADGQVAFDRRAQATINTIERAEAATPDFSQQGIVESFNALIDRLKLRYAYTNLRQVDWEKIRAQYLPIVQQAETANSMAAYYYILETMALSLRDAHVTVAGPIALFSPFVITTLQDYRSGVGASVINVSDPGKPNEGPPGTKFLVLAVGSDSPAAEAGWVPGTEIVAIDGKPPQDRFAEIPLFLPVGTAEAARMQQMSFMLSFPLSKTVDIAYRLPDTSTVLTATMVAGQYEIPGAPLRPALPDIYFKPAGKYQLIGWKDFGNYPGMKIETLEAALTAAQDAPGIILDLRGNGGGWIELMQIMESYFFAADNPMPQWSTDWWTYEEKAGGLVKMRLPAAVLSAPRRELAYTGPVVILIDNNCGSACEYMTQQMQYLDRAKVVGQYSTAGAGGPVEGIAMPGGMSFYYTYGRTTFPESEVFNLEGKGVVPDIRVPVTLETELAKREGKDPVLDAAIAELDRQTGQ